MRNTEGGAGKSILHVISLAAELRQVIRPWKTVIARSASSTTSSISEETIARPRPRPELANDARYVAARCRQCRRGSVFIERRLRLGWTARGR